MRKAEFLEEGGASRVNSDILLKDRDFERQRASNLAFYAQSTRTVASGRETDRQTDRQTENESAPMKETEYLYMYGLKMDRNKNYKNLISASTEPHRGETVRCYGVPL